MERTNDEFWKEISIEDMDHSQWESLCDGCGRCCLKKIYFEDTKETFYTRVACRFLDLFTCACITYEKRASSRVGCITLSLENLGELRPILPATCAYRLVAEGRDLPEWHPLISGDRQSVHEAGISVQGKVVSEEDVYEDDPEHYIIDWIDY